MISEPVKRQLQIIFAALMILVGFKVFWVTGKIAEIILDPSVIGGYSALILFGLILVVLGAVIMGWGVEILLDLIEAAHEEDTFFDILRDFPPTKFSVYGKIEDRIIKRLLVNNEETIHLKALQKILDERKTS